MPLNVTDALDFTQQKSQITSILSNYGTWIPNVPGGKKWMKLLVSNKNILTGGYYVKSMLLATHHYRLKHVACRRPRSAGSCPSWPLVNPTMAPRHGATRWRYLARDHFDAITTAMQCTQRKHQQQRHIIALHKARLVFAQSGTGTAVIMPPSFRVKVVHVQFQQLRNVLFNSGHQYSDILQTQFEENARNNRSLLRYFPRKLVHSLFPLQLYSPSRVWESSCAGHLNDGGRKIKMSEG